jgi:hypothetical protein
MGGGERVYERTASLYALWIVGDRKAWKNSCWNLLQGGKEGNERGGKRDICDSGHC